MLQGELKYPDGSTFVGKWFQGKKHGEGMQIGADGSVSVEVRMTLLAYSSAYHYFILDLVACKTKTLIQIWDNDNKTFSKALGDGTNFRSLIPPFPAEEEHKLDAEHISLDESTVEEKKGGKPAAKAKDH